MTLSTPALTLAVGALLALGACGTPANLASLEGAPAENGNRNGGAAIGAVLGGLLAGPVTGGSTGRAAAGVAAGAAVGGLIGADLDRQAAELRRDLGNDRISVETQGDQLLVSFPHDILFGTDVANVSLEQRQTLNTLAANLSRYPQTRAAIIGHTDNIGSAAYNSDLSARRAGAVSQVLVDGGVAPARLTATGQGEDAPIATNLTEDGRARNRRVEVVITADA